MFYQKKCHVSDFVNASKPEPSLSVNGMPAKELKFWDSSKFQTENRQLQNER